ncbi:MAG: glycosyltransferase family 2 protein [Patescibacteria group bacterium]
MIANKKIAIILPTYNGKDLLPDCLASLERQDYPPELLTIIAVDDNSTDGTVEYLQKNQPQIKIISNQKNRGFAAVNNQGYDLARQFHPDYLVLLNQDTIVDVGWLKSLIGTISQDKNIAIVQPKILLHPETNLINSFGNSIHFLGFGFCNYYRHPDNLPATLPFELPYASGAACLIDLKALEKVGLFDDRFFMYHEDVDLGWRLRLAGYKILLDPSAVIYHKYNYSKAVYKFYHMDRNRWLVMLQNYRLGTLLLFAPALIVMELGIILFSIKNGWFKEKIRGWRWILRHWSEIMARHSEIQSKMRRVGDREIVRLYVGSIKFQDVDNALLKCLVNPVTEAYFWLAKKVIFW